MPRGFTLIELVMVIVITGALAIIAGPRFFSTTAFDERFYIEDVVAGLRFARRSAEVSNCSVRFRTLATGFDLDYNANCLSGGAASYTLAVNRPGDGAGAYASNEKPSSLLQSATSTAFVFLPGGGVTNLAGSTVSPVLTLSGSESSQTISVNGITGYAQIP